MLDAGTIGKYRVQAPFSRENYLLAVIDLLAVRYKRIDSDFHYSRDEYLMNCPR